MTTRDKLLVIVFATVGMNAGLADLAAGGRVLGILCLITVAFVILQDTVGTVGAVLLGMPKAAGVAGSVSLVGDHGTAIAWGPMIAAEHGFPAALESGVAAATVGLIVASLLGGPAGEAADRDKPDRGAGDELRGRGAPAGGRRRADRQDGG
jgi:ESS family glutamate:Na+ symporter